MSAFEFRQYCQGMDVLKARENLMQMRLICAPEMNKKERQKLFTRLSKEAYPREAVPMTAENLSRIING